MKGKRERDKGETEGVHILCGMRLSHTVHVHVHTVPAGSYQPLSLGGLLPSTDCKGQRLEWVGPQSVDQGPCKYIHKSISNLNTAYYNTNPKATIF